MQEPFIHPLPPLMHLHGERSIFDNPYKMRRASSSYLNISSSTPVLSCIFPPQGVEGRPDDYPLTPYGYNYLFAHFLKFLDSFAHFAFLIAIT